MVGDQFGGIDVTFLPINGAIIGQNTGIATAAVMTPSQALDASSLIRAQVMVPIHYGLNDPPHYVEFPGALEKTLELAVQTKVEVRPLQPGEGMTLD